MSTETTARSFAEALASRDAAALRELLADDVTLLAWTWEGSGASRPLAEVIEALLEATEHWLPGSLEVLTMAANEASGAVQFRVQSREGRKVPRDQNGGAFFALEDGKVSRIDLYLARPFLAAERHRILKADVSQEERAAIVESLAYRFDIREFFPPNTRLTWSHGHSRLWTKLAHPGSNHVRRVQWSAEEADQRIEETMGWFRERGLGVQWNVGPHDTPADLGERLIAHGFLRAGDQAMMLRFGLESLEDIAINPEIEVVDLKERPDLWEASLQLTATAFHWPAEQTENERAGWFEDLQSRAVRAYMALIDGVPVAHGQLILQSGVAYLGGAATLPEYRSRKIYSTLLRRRLEQAREEGYEVAMIHAEPMSRRVVSKFGFETVAMYDVYGWMEPMDAEVIRQLVVDD